MVMSTFGGVDLNKSCNKLYSTVPNDYIIKKQILPFHPKPALNGRTQINGLTKEKKSSSHNR
jgi:hypothetical protein